MNAAAELSDKGQFNRYFAMMLHIDDDDLDPFEYKLLGHYRKVCGLSQQNVCFEANETTAKATKMSVAKMRDARKSLAKKGCIELDEPDGRSIRVFVCDRTAENLSRYSGKTPTKNVRGIKNVTPTKKITPIKSDRSDLPKTSPDKELKNLKQESFTNVQDSSASQQAAPTSAPIGQDVSKLPEPPKGKAWFSSSDFGTEYAHLAKTSSKLGCLCKASIRHRNKYSAALGPRKPCPDCLKASEPKPKATQEPLPWSALTKAMHEATPEDIRPVTCNYGRNDAPAHALFDAGFTPERITAFVLDNYPTYREWAEQHKKPVIMSMHHVNQYIKAWEATKGKKVAVAPATADVPEETQEETEAWLESLKTRNVSRAVKNDAWIGTMEDLQVRVNRATFDTWFKPMCLVMVKWGEPRVFSVEVPSQGHKDYVERHLMHSLVKILKDRARCEVRVEIRVAAAKAS